MDDIKRALLGDHEAAQRLTEQGVLLECPWCGKTVAHVGTIAEHELMDKDAPGYDWCATHYDAVCDATNGGCGGHTGPYKSEYEARLAWNTRAAVEMEGMEAHKMTREENIKRLKALKARCERLIVSSDRGPEEWRKDAEALNLALAALRGPTREMVERMRGEWNYSHTTEIDRFAVVKCSKCGHEAFAMALYVKDGNFCPSCGAPMTDEAVDMMLERWKEALNNDR